MKEERMRESYDRLLAIRASGEADRTSCLTPEAIEELLQPEFPKRSAFAASTTSWRVRTASPNSNCLRSVAKAEPRRPFPG
jgi:hypothetical protein